jgi:formylglycine-generating enzyme required for sulfatase activity
MSDIFLSYKSEDRAKAQIIAEALESNGYSVWWDRVIPPGRKFDDVIEEELAAAKCMVVLWSKESVKSDWVKTEASEGKRLKILIPVLIEDVTLPLAFSRIEAAKLIDWDGTLPHSEFDLLLGSVSRMLGNVPVTEMEIQKTGEQEEEELKKTEINKQEEEMSEKEKQERKKKEEEDRIQKEKERQHELRKSTIKKKIQEKSHAIMKNKGNKKMIIGVVLIFSMLLVGYSVFLILDNILTKTTPMEFTLIPDGEFEMGYLDQKHSVTISEDFYMSKFEVTQEQWHEVMGYNPSKFRGDNLPVENVSWDDVQDFIRKLNKKENTTIYRLPTEAEWEYAARAGTTTEYSFGDDASGLGDYAWYYDNSGKKTHPVGKKQRNSWDLHDMHGNLQEWVQDEWHSSYEGAPTDGSVWENGSSGAFRVVRGGGWSNSANTCRSASRSGHVQSACDPDTGFRLIKEI